MAQKIVAVVAVSIYLGIVVAGYAMLVPGLLSAFYLVAPTADLDIFNFSDFLTALALLLLVITTSDFRHRYRLTISRIEWAKAGFWLAGGICAALLAVELWYSSGWPVLAFARSVAVPKLILGGVFLVFMFLALWVAFFKRPTLTRGNAEFFVKYHFQLLHGGNAEYARVVASELQEALADIIRFANRSLEIEESRSVTLAAKQFISLIGDRRFCRVVATEVPAFALTAFAEAQQQKATPNLPIYQFARNIGQELIRDTNSAFYQEDSWFDSGLMGLQREATRIVFGNYRFVEQCAEDGASPLDTDHLEFARFSDEQIGGYFRAALAFSDSYLQVTKGRAHSYAFHRLLGNVGGIGGRLYRLSGNDDLLKMVEYHQLDAATRFIRELIDLISKHTDADPTIWIPASASEQTVRDQVASCIGQLVLGSGNVSGPTWTTWSVQHNSIWNIFTFDDGPTTRVIGAKLRRLLFDEIKKMDRRPNFQGARALGFCLNVLGLTPRRRGYGNQWYPLQKMALRWTKRNYLRLVDAHPLVASACLHGSVTYDALEKRLVNEFGDDTGKVRPREYLPLDPQPPGAALPA